MKDGNEYFQAKERRKADFSPMKMGKFVVKELAHFIEKY